MRSQEYRDCQTKIHNAKTETRRAWPGGPLREFSGTRRLAYVCDRCREPAHGVYRVGDDAWLCENCKNGSKRVPQSSKQHPARCADPSADAEMYISNSDLEGLLGSED